MTKVRVHELAKELNKSNKEILDFLQEKKVEVKSHMSSLTDEQENMVKDAFGGKKEASSEETPKKKNIVQVFRPQNTQNGKRQGGQRSNNGGNNQRGNGTGQKDRQNNNYRSGNGTNSRGNNNNQGSRNGDNRGERSGNRPFNRGERSGENRGENRNYNNRGVRKADSPVREEEMTADRTTEEITEEEMTEDRRMEEELLRPFLHQLFRSRNHSARRAKRTIKRKITGMTTEKKDFQKGRNKNRCHSR